MKPSDANSGNESEKNTQSIDFKAWLEKLQQESWQLELLISGFALYGIYAAKPFINELRFIGDNLEGTQRAFFSLFGLVIEGAWMVFFTNLIIHVVLRGLWIGAIGLRYVSADIDYKELKYSDYFVNYLKKKIGSYDDYIGRLERVCSIIFAYTFLLVMLFLSLILFIGQIGFLNNIIMKVSHNEMMVGLSTIIYFSLGMIVFFDFITLGMLKTINEGRIQRIYMYIYRYFSWTTLSFLYRPLLYNFIDNSYTKKLFYFSVPYLFLMLSGEGMFKIHPHPYVESYAELREDGLIIEDRYYDDLRIDKLNEFPNEERRTQRSKLPEVTLSNFNHTTNSFSYFVRIRNNMDELINHKFGLHPKVKKGLNIAWFGLDKTKDPRLEILEDTMSQDYSKLFKEYRKLRNDDRKGKEISETRFKTLKDSLNYIRTTKKKLIDDYESKYKTKVFDAYKSTFTAKIDGIELDKKSCYYFTHSNYGEIGLKCFYNLDSLKAGMHTFEFEKEYLESDTIDVEITVLPFLVE